MRSDVRLPWIPALLTCLILSALPLVGCGDTSASSRAEQAADDPVAKFEWGMQRLERAVLDFRPTVSDGVSITERKVSHELFPPGTKADHYTAVVTVTTEAEFLHDIRKKDDKEEKAEEKKEELEIDDPLEDKDAKLIDIPGAGPEVPAAAAQIEPRSLDSETVFELAFLDGAWKLTSEPEEKYEQLWFEYAFE